MPFFLFSSYLHGYFASSPSTQSLDIPQTFSKALFLFYSTLFLFLQGISWCPRASTTFCFTLKKPCVCVCVYFLNPRCFPSFRLPHYQSLLQYLILNISNTSCSKLTTWFQPTALHLLLSQGSCLVERHLPVSNAKKSMSHSWHFTLSVYESSNTIIFSF